MCGTFEQWFCLLADLVGIEVEICERAVNLEGLCDRHAALWANVIAHEVEARQRAVDTQGLGDRLADLDPAEGS